MHIYAFGSVCRGDVSLSSDVDLLAIVCGHDPRFNTQEYSIYSYERVREIWAEGNPFAWHLSLEARLLYASDALDFLGSLGRPKPYRTCRQDCEKFFALFQDARESFGSQASSRVFDLSMVFLAVRNFATCFSLGRLPRPDFSRSSALRLGTYSLSIPSEAYGVLERSRLLSTRAVGPLVTGQEAGVAFDQFCHIEEWMKALLREVA
jgi:hypothetical protein